MPFILTYLSRLPLAVSVIMGTKNKAPPAIVFPDRVLLAHDADMACRDNGDSFAYDSEGERWSVYHAGGPTTI